MNTYHAAFWSSDPSRLSSSDEEEEDRNVLMKLVERMPRVCKAVIKAKGGYFEESKI